MASLVGRGSCTVYGCDGRLRAGDSEACAHHRRQASWRRVSVAQLDEERRRQAVLLDRSIERWQQHLQRERTR